MAFECLVCNSTGVATMSSGICFSCARGSVSSTMPDSKCGTAGRVTPPYLSPKPNPMPDNPVRLPTPAYQIARRIASDFRECVGAMGFCDYEQLEIMVTEAIKGDRQNRVVATTSSNVVRLAEEIFERAHKRGPCLPSEVYFIAMVAEAIQAERDAK